MKGRRLPDTRFGDLPEEDLRPGDYWKCLSGDGTPMRSAETGNLTETVWQIVAPTEQGGHCGVATLTKHTVREHEDGTISVRAGDGSSNSILVSTPRGRSWHGYIDHGVWEKC